MATKNEIQNEIDKYESAIRLLRIQQQDSNDLKDMGLGPQWSRNNNGKILELELRLNQLRNELKMASDTTITQTQQQARGGKPTNPIIGKWEASNHGINFFWSFDLENTVETNNLDRGVKVRKGKYRYDGNDLILDFDFGNPLKVRVSINNNILTLSFNRNTVTLTKALGYQTQRVRKRDPYLELVDEFDDCPSEHRLKELAEKFRKFPLEMYPDAQKLACECERRYIAIKKGNDEKRAREEKEKADEAARIKREEAEQLARWKAQNRKGFLIQFCIAASYFILLSISGLIGILSVDHYFFLIISLFIVTLILYLLERSWIHSYSPFGIFLVIGMAILNTILLYRLFSGQFVFYLVGSIAAVFPSVCLFRKHLA